MVLIPLVAARYVLDKKDGVQLRNVENGLSYCIAFFVLSIVFYGHGQEANFGLLNIA